MRPPRPLPRTVTVVSPPESSTQGGGHGLAAPRDLQRDAGHRLADVARLALDRVAEDVAASMPARARPRPPLRAPSAAWRSDESRCRQTRIAGLQRLALAALEQIASARAAGRCRSGARPRSASAQVDRVGHGRSRGDVDGSSPGTSEISRVSDACRVAGRREPAALDRREVLAHAVHLADGRAAREQRLVERLLVAERQASARQRQQRPSRRRRSGRARDRRRVSPRRAPGCAWRPSRRPRRAPDGRPRRSRCARTARRGRSA